MKRQSDGYYYEKKVVYGKDFISFLKLTHWYIWIPFLLILFIAMISFEDGFNLKILVLNIGLSFVYLFCIWFILWSLILVILFCDNRKVKFRRIGK
jgi:hypothetical protein